MTRIVLVRHGRTGWNAVERFRGRADIPLDEVGQTQAETTGERIAREWQPVAVYSSPLSRALDTARVIASRRGLEVQEHSGLLDIDYGEWQGLTPQEVGSRWPDALRDWYERPQAACIPSGETLAAVRGRAMDAVAELAAMHHGETIALISHTVVNRLILLGVLGLGNDRFWRLRQDTCAVNVIEAEGGGYTLVTMNDTCHLSRGPA